MSKQYGLILPGKNKGGLVVTGMVARHSAFNEESDSDEEVKKPITFNTKPKRQDKLLQQKAVEEDPTVYQYDEVYDEIDLKRKESILSKKDVEKKPKYITKLLAAADRRKRENERRIERQVQKEREAEGDEFKDKEAFVTSAYKKKLEELKALEEQEKREEYLEAIGDVQKQGNLDGFYRHLYDQKVNYEDKDDKKQDKVEIKEEQVSEEDEGQEETTQESHEDQKSEGDEEKVKTKTKSKKRAYRQRKGSNSDEDNEEENGGVKKLEHLPSNIDADSDFSIDSSDSEDEGQSKTKKPKVEDEDRKEQDDKDTKNEVKVKQENGGENLEKVEDKSKEDGKKEDKVKKEKKEGEFKAPKEVPKKPKIDIWKKRTVGEVFDAALQRYFERKALRESGS